MNWKKTDRIVAGVVFTCALVLYLLTMAPTVSFWDSGEFIASVHGLQVMHPPGAPFYMLLGRFFSMFIPAEYVALSVNLLSVLASALTVLLTHLIIVRLVRHWQGTPDEWTTPQRITALAGGAIGALTFAATDSFWFNAVEAEVYALSMLFTAAVVWLILRWSEAARKEEALLSGGRHLFALNANRYLVLIAYLFGLAIGVHLLNLLAFFFIALIVFFTEFDTPDWTSGQRWKGILLTGAIASGIFFMIYPGLILGLPELADQSGSPFLILLLTVALITYGVYYTHTRKLPAANLAALCLAVIFIGYSTYALIPIRSETEPAIDLMDPDTGESFVSYMKREQYGSRPLLKGVSYNEATGQVDPQSGEEQWFPRRYSPNQQHMRVYERYNSDLSFFLDYQIGHMYVRYFLWNFAGRASDIQDAPAITGIPAIDPDYNPPQLQQTPSEQASRNVYFALPLLLGLFGAFYHFSRDWRRALSVFTLFFITGIGIVIYLNQTPMQPRERDYSYVASFFAFSLWVGIGATGLLEWTLEALRDRFKTAASLQKTSLFGVAAFLFAVVPAWMTYQNYDDHDRSGNYVARDYAHNMLMSLDKNAILFTNGDNDTYPLWYLQSVENVRPDVRVVNLSLLNTPWYTEQLKEETARESPPLPISLPDNRIRDLGLIRWNPRTVKLPVNRDQFTQDYEMYLSPDTSALESPMSWRLEGRPFGQDFNVLQGADQVAYNILRTNAEQGWTRPVYFAITVAPSGQLNLQNFFQMEGLTYRVVPIRHDQPMGRVVPEITPDRLRNFRFTKLDDPNVYFNDNVRRMLDAYRNIFAHTAERLAAKGESATGEELLNTLMTSMPFTTMAGDARSYLLMARAFDTLGNQEKVVDLMQQAEPEVFYDLEHASSQRDFGYALQFAGLVRMTYQEASAPDALAAFDEELNQVLARAPYQVPDQIRSAYGLGSSSGADSAAVPGNIKQPPSSPSN